MAQAEVLQYLIRRRNTFVPLTELCISLRNCANRENISRACRKLHKAKEIEIRKEKQGQFIRYLVRVRRN